MRKGFLFKIGLRNGNAPVSLDRLSIIVIEDYVPLNFIHLNEAERFITPQ
jgi:hypothetical protein